ncbi:hypothetical protein [Shewanella algae]|uniref:hypothetical protein n=1 Tax=Shewanella algae TaxID=38313 RepID=UPI000F4267E9|nr:hypothetical protein [Shewanella algae]AYV14063.1 hypothetical protein EEY24_14930 [Shewanella algae]
MSQLPEGKRKEIWQMLFALDCFQNVEEVCRYILKEKIVNGNPMYHSLLTSAYTIYGRPFKKSYGIGRLDESFVPKNLLETHREIIAHRDRMFAHTDVNGTLEGTADSLNQVELHVLNGRYQWIIRAIQAEPDFIETMMDASIKLAKKSDNRVQELNQVIGKFAPKKNGAYKLVLDKQQKAFVATE